MLSHLTLTLTLVVKGIGNTGTHSQHQGSTTMVVGGVGGNIARALAQLGEVPALISAVGADPYGKLVEEELENLGIGTQGLRRVQDTAVYHAILDHNGDLMGAIAAMEALSAIDPPWLLENPIPDACLIVADANLSEAALRVLVEEV